MKKQLISESQLMNWLIMSDADSWTADRVTLNHTKDSCCQSIIRRESLNNRSRFFEYCYCWTPTYYKRLCYITACIISQNLSNIPSFSFTCRLNYRFKFEILIKFYISVWGFILYKTQVINNYYLSYECIDKVWELLKMINLRMKRRNFRVLKI